MGRVLVGMTVGHGDESVRDVAQLAVEIEQAGLDAVGFSDSQSVFRETYCNMTAATKRRTGAPCLVSAAATARSATPGCRWRVPQI